jgi:phosphatidylglycerol:prolipoprotein diacylglycerol transferase
MYGILYSITRIIAEFYRQPDLQLGFIYSNWLTMGILQSLIVLGVCMILYINRKKVSS